ncbi:MAG: 50S ribosomal protein L11 methyltransferase [Flavobacteriaceae bacterium]|nr:50S ribosomal protein L11 methyltransferase [Flavobacteriaceae bacterium]
MIYIGYHFEIEPLQPGSDILVAELGEEGFESFVETEKGISAFIQKKDWHKDILKNIRLLSSGEFRIAYTSEEIAQVNWNTEWEKNFEPIMVNNMVSVRAPFHEKTDLPYEIVIEPKMSFGTGHHETTHMMIQQILTLELKDKTVLDMGSGTGILAIMAEMRGAKSVDAIDIDDWCYENALENTARNNCTKVHVFKGDAALLADKHYDVIIANINRNVLLNDLPFYHKCLNKGGVLLLSGFYREDIPFIKERATGLGMQESDILEKNNWISMKFVN